LIPAPGNNYTSHKPATPTTDWLASTQRKDSRNLAAESFGRRLQSPWAYNQLFLCEVRKINRPLALHIGIFDHAGWVTLAKAFGRVSSVNAKRNVARFVEAIAFYPSPKSRFGASPE
jgi:hypothetical protein